MMRDRRASESHLCLFPYPSEGMFRALAAILDGLEIRSDLQPADCRRETPNALREMRRMEEDVDFRGSASKVLATLRSTLRQDVRSWRSEVRSYNIVYEIAVDVSDCLKGAIDILTRVHDGKGSGAISYGRTVLRHQDDEYWLWIDD